MKTLISLLAFLLFCFTISCKKEKQQNNQQQGPCDTVVCNHGHCVSGACVCDTGWTGTHCDVKISPTLFDTIAGIYLVNGRNSEAAPLNGGYNDTIINDTLFITALDSGISLTTAKPAFIDHQMKYAPSDTSGTFTFYSVNWPSGSYQWGVTIKLYKNDVDSLNMTAFSYHACCTEWKFRLGRKIH